MANDDTTTTRNGNICPVVMSSNRYMKKYCYLIVLLSFTSLVSGQEKKKFLASFDIMTNIHPGDVSVAKENWFSLFENRPTSYSPDTFYQSGPGRAIVRVQASMSVRVAGSLFGKNEHRLVKDRFEWRAGLLFSPKVKSSSEYSGISYLFSSFIPPLRSNHLYLTYQRSWLDLNGYIAYKIPSFLLKNRLRYHIATGLGFTSELNGKITENRVGYTRTPSGGTMGGFIVTEEYNTTRTEKAKTVVSPYWSLAGTTEIIFSKNVSVLLEGTYQGYVGSIGLNKRLYEGGGYLSLAFRYKF